VSVAFPVFKDLMVFVSHARDISVLDFPSGLLVGVVLSGVAVFKVGVIGSDFTDSRVFKSTNVVGFSNSRSGSDFSDSGGANRSDVSTNNMVVSDSDSATTGNDGLRGDSRSRMDGDAASQSARGKSASSGKVRFNFSYFSHLNWAGRSKGVSGVTNWGLGISDVSVGEVRVAKGSVITTTLTDKVA